MQLSNSITLAARNAMQDANAALQLNFALAPRTFAQMHQQLSREYSGDALYKKILADAEN